VPFFSAFLIASLTKQSGPGDSVHFQKPMSLGLAYTPLNTSAKPTLRLRTPHALEETE
jgi:hypothetical protein